MQNKLRSILFNRKNIGLIVINGIILTSALSITTTLAKDIEEREQTEYAIHAKKAITSLITDITKIGDRIIAVGERGHILYSDDGGLQWNQAQSAPTTANLTTVSFVSSKLGWAAGHDATILHTTDGGVTWQLQYTDPEIEIHWLDIWFADESNGFVIGAYGNIMKTENGGKNWQDISSTIPISEELGSPHLYAFEKTEQDDIFIVGEFGSIFRSNDNGNNWETIPSPYEGSFFGIIILPKETLIVFGLRGHIFRSEDNGMSWQEIESPITTGLMGGKHTDDGAIILTGNSGNILKSNDNGQTFALTTRENRYSITNLTATENRLILVGQKGIHLVSKQLEEIPDKPLLQQ